MHSTLFFVLVTTAVVYGKTTFISVPSEQLPALLDVSVKCIGKTGVDADVLQKLISWTFQDSEKVRQYIYCFGTSAGFADHNGHLIKDNVLKVIGRHKIRDDVAKAVDECNKTTGTDKYETIYKTVICFHQKAHVEFKL